MGKIEPQQIHLYHYVLWYELLCNLMDPMQKWQLD